jgi:hypothetical protein
MVQVDIFWSYGIGAGLAVAAHRQIAKQKESRGTLWENARASPHFSSLLLFLGLIFVPSGMWLLWEFSSWETMHAADRNLPVWLVGLFAVTNVSQGILAFVICYYLIRRGRLYAAWLNFVGAYIGFFLILIYGWDGTGYQRFFASDRAAFENWSWSTARAWFSSDIALTLYGMGVILLPTLGGMTLSRIQGGAREAGVPSRIISVLSGFFGSILLLALGLALMASLLLIQLGIVRGTLLSFCGLLVLLHPKLGIARRFYRAMTVEEV